MNEQKSPILVVYNGYIIYCTRGHTHTHTHLYIRGTNDFINIHCAAKLVYWLGIN